LNTSEKLKNFKNRAGSLFSPRVLSPILGFEGEETPTKIDALPQIQTKGFSQLDFKTLGNNS